MMAHTLEGKKSAAMLRSSPRLSSSTATRSSPRTKDLPTTRASPRFDRLSSTPGSSPAKTTATLTSGDGPLVKQCLLEKVEEKIEGKTTRVSPRSTHLCSTTGTSSLKTRASSPRTEAILTSRDRPVIRALKRRLLLKEAKEVNAEGKMPRASPRSARLPSTTGASIAIEGDDTPVIKGVKRCLPDEGSGGLNGERKSMSVRVKLHHLKPDVLEKFCGKPAELRPRELEENTRKAEELVLDGSASKFLKSLAEGRPFPHREVTSVEPSTVGEPASLSLRLRSHTGDVDRLKSEVSDDAQCFKCRDPGLPDGAAHIPCKCRHSAVEIERGKRQSDERRSELQEVAHLENSHSSACTSDCRSESHNSGSERLVAAHSENSHRSESGKEKTGNAQINPATDTDGVKGKRGCLIDWFAHPEYVWLGYESNVEEYLCMRCALRETSLSAFLRHSITNPQITRCNICGAQWTSQCLERIHCLKQHQFLCHFCPKQFKTSREAFEHGLESHPNESVPKGSWGTYHGGPRISLSHMPRQENILHGVLVGKLREPPPDGSSPYIVTSIPGAGLSRKQAMSEKYSAFVAMRDAYEAGEEVNSSVVMCPLCPSILKDFPGVEHHVNKTHRPNNSRELGDTMNLDMMTRQAISKETPSCEQCNRFFQNHTALRKHTAVVHAVSTPYRLALSQQKAKDLTEELKPHRDSGTEILPETSPGAIQSSPSVTRNSKIQHCNETDVIDVEAVDDTPKNVVDAKKLAVATSGKLGTRDTDEPTPGFSKLRSILDGDAVERHLPDSMLVGTGNEITETGSQRNNTFLGKAAPKPAVVKSRSDNGNASWDLPHSLFSLFSLRDCTPAILQEVDSQIEKALKDLKFGQSRKNRLFSASHFQAGGPVAAYMKLKPVLDNPPRTPTARQNYKMNHRYKIPMGHFNPEFEETPLFPTLRDLYTRTNGYKQSPLSILTTKEVKKSPLVGIYSKKDKKLLAKHVSKAVEESFMKKSMECIQAASRGHTMFRRGYDMQSHSFLSDRVVSQISKKFATSRNSHRMVDRSRVNNLSIPQMLQEVPAGSVNYNQPNAMRHALASPINDQQQGQRINVLTSQGRMQIVVNPEGHTTVVPYALNTSKPSAQGTETVPGFQHPPQTSASHRQVILLPRPNGPLSFPMHGKSPLPPLIPATQAPVSATQAPVSATQAPERLVLGTLTPSDVVRLQQLGNARGALLRGNGPQTPPPPPLQLAPRVFGYEKPRTVNAILAQQRQQQLIQRQPPPLQRAPSDLTKLTNPGTGRKVIIIQPMKKPVEPTGVSTNLPGGIQAAAASRPPVIVPGLTSSDAGNSNAQPAGSTNMLTLRGDPSYCATSAPVTVPCPPSSPVFGSHTSTPAPVTVPGRPSSPVFGSHTLAPVTVPGPPSTSVFGSHTSTPTPITVPGPLSSPVFGSHTLAPVTVPGPPSTSVFGSHTSTPTPITVPGPLSSPVFGSHTPALVTVPGPPSSPVFGSHTQGTGASVNFAQRVPPLRLPRPLETEAGVQGGMGTFLMKARQTIFRTLTSVDPRPCPPLVQMKPIPQGEQHCMKARSGGVQETEQPPPEVIRVSPEKKLIVKYKDGSCLTLPFGQKRDNPVESEPGTPVKSKGNCVVVKPGRSLSVEWYCRKLHKRKKYEKRLRRKLRMGVDYSSMLKLTKTIRQEPIVTTNVLCRAVDAGVVMKVSEAVRRGKRATIKLDDYRHLCYRYIKTGLK